MSHHLPPDHDPHHPSAADLAEMLAYELTCAQIHALQTLSAIAQDLSNPKEARIAATTILKFKPPPLLKKKLAAAAQGNTHPPAHPHVPMDADAALDAHIAADPTRNAPK